MEIKIILRRKPRRDRDSYPLPSVSDNKPPRLPRRPNLTERSWPFVTSFVLNAALFVILFLSVQSPGVLYSQTPTIFWLSPVVMPDIASIPAFLSAPANASEESPASAEPENGGHSAGQTKSEPPPDPVSAPVSDEQSDTGDHELLISEHPQSEPSPAPDPAPEQARRAGIDERKRAQRDQAERERLASEQIRQEREVQTKLKQERRMQAEQTRLAKAEQARSAAEQARQAQMVREQEQALKVLAEQERLASIRARQEHERIARERSPLPASSMRHEAPIIKTATNNEQPSEQHTQKPRGMTLPLLKGDLKLVIAGSAMPNVNITFREFPLSRRSKPLSRAESRRAGKIVPFITSPGANMHEFLIEQALSGIYTITVEPANGATEVEFYLKLYEGTTRDFTQHSDRQGVSGKQVVVKVLMPEGILWDDDKSFTGSMEDSEGVTKFNARTGLTWKEYY